MTRPGPRAGGVGVRKGTHVGRDAARTSPRCRSTWLALGTLGAVMVPVNIGYTERELRYVARQRRRRVRWSSTRPAWPSLEQCVARTAARASRAARDRRRRARAGALSRLGRRWRRRCRRLHAPPAPVGARRPAQHPVHLGHDRLSQGLHADAALLADERQGQRLPRRRGATQRILASTPFFYMDPQWLLLMTFYQRGTLFVARAAERQPVHGWVREHQHRVLPVPVPRLQAAGRSPDDAQRRSDPRATSTASRTAIHAQIEERFDFVAREAFGMTEIGSAHVHADRGDRHGRLGLVRHARSRSANARIVDDERQAASRRRGRRAAACAARRSCTAITTIRKRPQGAFARRLVPHRRPVPPGRARLLLHRRPASRT